jgi:hypothetical protein
MTAHDPRGAQGSRAPRKTTTGSPRHGRRYDFRGFVACVNLRAVLGKLLGPPVAGRYPCPFHDDTRPSLTEWVAPDAGPRFRCWACGAGGDVLEFVSRLLCCPVVQAARWLVDNGLAAEMPRPFGPRASRAGKEGDCGGGAPAPPGLPPSALRRAERADRELAERGF